MSCLQASRGGVLLGQDYLQRLEISSGMPVSLTIETTSVCNLRCVMCPQPNLTRPRQHMPLALFEKIIAEAKGFVEFAILHLFGEPLLNPAIYRMISLAESSGIRTLFSTNATKLDHAAGYQLLQNPLSFLQVCIDGASAETYEKVRIGGRFHAVLANIRRFAALLKEHPERHLKVAVQMIDMEMLSGERDAFLEMWKDAGFDAVFIKGFHVWGNRRPDLITIAPSVQAPGPPGAVCFMPWSELTILSDGRVVPCCNDFDGQYLLGDAATESIGEIWNGPAMRQLRGMFANPEAARVGTICARCPVPQATPDLAAFGLGPFDPRARWHAEFGFADSAGKLPPGRNPRSLASVDPTPS